MSARLYAPELPRLHRVWPLDNVQEIRVLGGRGHGKTLGRFNLNLIRMRKVVHRDTEPTARDVFHSRV